MSITIENCLAGPPSLGSDKEVRSFDAVDGELELEVEGVDSGGVAGKVGEDEATLGLVEDGLELREGGWASSIRCPVSDLSGEGGEGRERERERERGMEGGRASGVLGQICREGKGGERERETASVRRWICGCVGGGGVGRWV
ncbi:hypothetical protein TIFTF001_019702 [Ficus carica]|uniref:Uncharacterized protein n=1 Tax=Ficus carica TaxID=3494 RepID=A0AA88DJG5_FICCA|nr:hypothetical protein TIFTF001_019702 [Ficus carica]